MEGLDRAFGGAERLVSGLGLEAISCYAQKSQPLCRHGNAMVGAISDDFKGGTISSRKCSWGMSLPVQREFCGGNFCVQADLLASGGIRVPKAHKVAGRRVNEALDPHSRLPSIHLPSEEADPGSCTKASYDPVQGVLGVFSAEYQRTHLRGPHRPHLQLSRCAFEKNRWSVVKAGHLSPTVTIRVATTPVVVLTTLPVVDRHGDSIDDELATEPSIGLKDKHLGLWEFARVQCLRKEQ